MKHRILLIGSDELMKECKKVLSDYFDIKTCGEDPIVVDGTMDIVEPELVIMNLSRNFFAGDILKVIENKTIKPPLICMGRYYDEEKHKSSLTYLNAQLYLREAVDDALVKAICVKGKFDYGEVISKNQNAESKRKVLIIDDSPLYLRRIKGMLEDNYEIMIAPSGAVGLGILRSKPVDVVLLDYEMPGMNGKEVFAKIKEDPKLADIPVIFLTAVSNKSTITDILVMKPSGYILKSTKQEAIIEKIDNV